MIYDLDLSEAKLDAHREHIARLDPEQLAEAIEAMVQAAQDGTQPPTHRLTQIASIGEAILS